MDIVATFAPPRICQFGGAPYWVRPMTLEDYATLIAWVDDVVPGRVGRKLPPPLDSPEARKAIESKHGLSVLTWIALRGQGVGYPDAATLAMAADDEEVIRLYEVLFARRRYMGEAGPGGTPLTETWFGPGMVGLGERVNTALGVLGKLTLDQIDCYATDGAPEEHPRRLTPQQVQDMWLASRPAESTDG